MFCPCLPNFISYNSASRAPDRSLEPLCQDREYTGFSSFEAPVLWAPHRVRCFLASRSPVKSDLRNVYPTSLRSLLLLSNTSCIYHSASITIYITLFVSLFNKCIDMKIQ